MKMNLPSGFQLFQFILVIVQFVIIVLITNYYAKRESFLLKSNNDLISENFEISTKFDETIFQTRKLKKEIEELRIRCATDSARLSYYSKSIKGLSAKINELKDDVYRYKINYKNTEIQNLNLKLQLQTIAKEAFTKTILAIDLDERFLLLQKLYFDTEAEYNKCIEEHQNSNFHKCLYCDKPIITEKTWCDHNCQASYFKEKANK